MENRYLNRPIVIKAPEFKDKGKQSADLFHARFLYAFSDVVVFVVNGGPEDQKRDAATLGIGGFRREEIAQPKLTKDSSDGPQRPENAQRRLL
jgi:hypothetical protein